MNLPEEQEEETEAIRAIFGEDFHGITNIPLSFMIQIQDNDLGNLTGPLYLKFSLTENYPKEAPKVEIVSKSLQRTLQEKLGCYLRDVANGLLGDPMVFSLVDAAKDWFISEEVQQFLDLNPNANDIFGDNNEEAEKDEDTQRDIPALEVKHKGGIWKFVIGLVGKPSAGKSTFFNAATCSSKAKVAAHPFTTIDPNIDTAYHTIECPCRYFDSRCDAEFGHSQNGERNVPVLIKDVAGLVPGASDGKGKGNRFLNDLCDADVLIHIVDASGCTDENGEQATGYDPRNDIEWLPNEIFRWIYDNIFSKWDIISRRPRRLIDMFTGYHASQSLIHTAFHNADIPLRSLEEDLPSWDSEVMLTNLVKEFMKLRFPIIVALNKADVESSETNIDRIQNDYGGEAALPVSAEAECLFQRLQKIDGDGGNAGHDAKLFDGSSTPEKERVLLRDRHQGFITRYGAGSVLRAINKAVHSKCPVYAFPVAQLDTLKSISTGRSDKGGILKHCLMMKTGSTVLDVYEMLTHALRLVTGKYVRAEGIDFFGENKHIIRKDELITLKNCILQIMTSKRN